MGAPMIGHKIAPDRFASRHINTRDRRYCTAVPIATHGAIAQPISRRSNALCLGIEAIDYNKGIG
jgi:hypothetical protein